MKTTKSGFTEAQRLQFRAKLMEMVVAFSEETKHPPEAVVLELRYFHEGASNPYRTNASAKDKKASLEFHQNKCQGAECGCSLVGKEIHYHHKKRGFPGQHEPENLVPMCIECHDKTHGASKGSLSKGSMKRSK
ncbi:MAG TPA: HNH endonuclease signature motif containing protein [Oligoflexus sp.]|uniref:HNH endonuclease n=1 Tax=Oligoflexus sp. TaxID=1971216 RepID=UPI002D7FB013|nr:HNH endonuclease signature motif containing protein [Oligoflexus sp.]HET9238148.1 HNH endonuclease signature motif containing protein [Oligoflexus sp.]